MNKLVVPSGLAAIILSGLLLLSSCQCSGDEENTNPESQFQINASIGSSVERFVFGEPVAYGISVSTSENASISPFPPAGWIKSLTNNEIICLYEAGNRTWNLGSGLSDNYRSKCFWYQKDDHGKQVKPGLYEIGYDWVIIEQASGKQYTANRSAIFNIIDPDSAMNKIIDVYQTVNDEGIPVTLERIELNAVETKVYVLAITPDYNMPETGQLEEWGLFVQSSVSEYRIGEGKVKQPVDRQANFGKDGARIIWVIDPVPSQSETLTFRITKLGDMDGLWEFKIPLQ